MGSIVSGLTGAQQQLLNTQQQDQEQMMAVQGQEDQISTQAQETTSMANTMNQIAKEFEDVSASKMQAQSEVAKDSSDATKQA